MSPNNSILVTGATGNQGTSIIHSCLSSPHIQKVYALVRDPTSPKSLSLQSAGAILLQGTYDDSVSSLTKHFSLASTIFYLPLNSDSDIPRTKNIISAVLASSPSVKQFIVSTTIKTNECKSFPGYAESDDQYPLYTYWNTKYQIEQLVKSAGFQSYTILRPSHFLQNLLLPTRNFLFPSLNKEDELPIFKSCWNPTTKVAWIDVLDQGKIVAAAINDPVGFNKREINLAVELLTPQELSDKIGKVWGKQVKAYQYTEEEQKELNPTIVASQKWANEVDHEGVTEVGKEFELTSVDEFLRRQDGF
ncbi:NAD(P)-binding protein [Podospora fimiseda]|uniref:NAD(P)-binding protein n=1 Tax=Podospora fimiseda TaxID=252190 RepID=A0AAN7GXK5_9PEZI|nr:NAD(P)-binding protein [Podospora fimiseda]